MMTAFASRRSEATTRTASRSRSASSREPGRSGTVASSVVTETPVKLVITPYYHEFHLPRIYRILARLEGIKQVLDEPIGVDIGCRALRPTSHKAPYVRVCP